MQPANERKRPRILGRMISVAVSLVMTTLFAVAGYYLIDWSAILTAYERTTGTQLAGIFLLGLIPSLLRVARLCVTIGQPLSWGLFRAVTLQMAAIATLPAKMGEAVLPVALMRTKKFTLSEGIGVLLLLRLYDLLVLAAFGAGALFILAAEYHLAGLEPLLVLGFSGAFILMLGLPCIVTLGKSAVHRYLNSDGWFVRLLDQISLAARDQSPRRLAGLIATSALVWLSLFLTFHLAGEALDATPGFAATTAAGVAGALAFALPVNGLANVGPFEAAWAGAMIPLGVSAEIAVAAAILSHITMILCSLTLAGVGVLQWAAFGSREPLI